MVDAARLADELRAEQVCGSSAWLTGPALADELRAEQVRGSFVWLMRPALADELRAEQVGVVLYG
jgi:hypothetical protein